MQTLSIDIETYSPIDLQKCGVYRYAEECELLLFGYSADDAPVRVIDVCRGEKMPNEVLEALTDESVEKWAYNAQFERICLSSYLKENYPEYLGGADYLSSKSGKCSMVWAAYAGLPGSLEAVGAVLKLSEQKLSVGKKLINYFCKPAKPTLINEGRERNMPWHDPGEWERFKEYNKRDVEVEEAIREKLKGYPVPQSVWEEYELDQEINDRGILIDGELAKSAIAIDERIKNELSGELKEITGLENPNSVSQLKKWLTGKDITADSLDKAAVKELLKSTDNSDVKTALELRQQLSKSSVKKYTAMETAKCADGRARGMFKFYGAPRTGRFSGKIIQLQNLPRNYLKELEDARELAKNGDYETLRMLYDNVPSVLSELIRTTFIPKEGCKFIVADFSAIEARVIAWLAGEKWRLDVFDNGGDIYCASASRMFKVPVEKHGVNSHLRQKGKIAELALGYGGAAGALKSMGALEMGLKEEELDPLVSSWREANLNIVRLWREVGSKIEDAVFYKTRTSAYGLVFSCKGTLLTIKLLSGRKLAYYQPRVTESGFGGFSVTYMGTGKSKKWERTESYGTKFVENIVQAISRDILCFAMKSLKKYRIVAHVHDEVIIECERGEKVEHICEIMSKTPPWAEGLHLTADGYETMFYKKD